MATQLGFGVLDGVAGQGSWRPVTRSVLGIGRPLIVGIHLGVQLGSVQGTPGALVRCPADMATASRGRKSDVNALPSALVPLVVMVMVFPAWDITVRPVALYEPPVFVRSSVNVLAFTCFTEMLSYSTPSPETVAVVPSYFVV